MLPNRDDHYQGAATGTYTVGPRRSSGTCAALVADLTITVPPLRLVRPRRGDSTVPMVRWAISLFVGVRPLPSRRCVGGHDSPPAEPAGAMSFCAPQRFTL